MRRGVGASFIAALALLVAAPAHASAGAQFGIQDDAWLMYGPGTLSERISTLQGLGVGIVRLTVRWNDVAPTEPSQARDPEDPAYQWGRYGEVLDELHSNGIPALVTLYGSPRWANGGAPPATLPAKGFGDFAYATAVRFPWVRLWTIWNEPNSRTFAVPVSPSAYVRTALNPAYAGLHDASGSNKVAGGVTSPRKTPTGMSPLAFMRGMHTAHARLDAYAQNPYAIGRGETPSHASCTDCFTMAVLPAIRSYVTRYFGAKPLWLTEYGYQTNPPDRLLGVSYALQARYIGEAASRVWRQSGVTVLIQFLVRDEPSVGGWQSGLFSVGGAPKLSYHAFALPLAEVSRHGAKTTLWGEVRPGAGARAYMLQRSVGGNWRAIGGTRRTARNGSFTVRTALPAGAKVRLFAPAVGWASPPLAIT